MRSLQQKLLLYIVIIGLVPMLFFTFYYCDFFQKDAYDTIEEESCSVLEQLDNKLAVKVSRIQNMVDILINDAEFCRILTTTGLDEETNAITQTKLDDIYGRFSRGEKELVTLMLFPVSGGCFVSGDKSLVPDPRGLIMEYDNSQLSAGTLSWMGLKNKVKGYEKEMILAGTILRDDTYLKDERYLATIYMLFDDSLFGNGSANEEFTYSEGAESAENTIRTENESISIYDEKINLIYSIGNKHLSNAYLTAFSEGYSEAVDSKSEPVVNIGGNKYMFISYTSTITGWKFVRTFPYERYQSGMQNITYVMIACLILMLALWYIVNHFAVRKMTLPIRNLLDAMKEVENNNLNVELEVNSRSDFGTINKGFNNMVVQIKSLFERIVSSEERRREQEVLMLRYQMNPHFLYNTINAIRLTAIMDRQGKIADMLLILGRFLRNAILTANELIVVENEIACIRDYVSLQQMRYMDGLKFELDAAEACLGFKIPGMLCQPIIENAIMHGLTGRLSSGEEAILRMNLTESEDTLLISVYDNGKGMSKEKISALFDDTNEDLPTQGSLHIGLKNIQKRIRLVFGPEYGVEVESEEGSYTIVKIKLPKIN